MAFAPGCPPLISTVATRARNRKISCDRGGQSLGGGINRPSTPREDWRVAIRQIGMTIAATAGNPSRKAVDRDAEIVPLVAIGAVRPAICLSPVPVTGCRCRRDGPACAASGADEPMA
jgi:hypothetical protein